MPSEIDILTKLHARLGRMCWGLGAFFGAARYFALPKARGRPCAAFFGLHLPWSGLSPRLQLEAQAHSHRPWGPVALVTEGYAHNRTHFGWAYGKCSHPSQGHTIMEIPARDTHPHMRYAIKSQPNASFHHPQSKRRIVTPTKYLSGAYLVINHCG